MAYVSVNSAMFRLIKAAIHSYIAGREQEARDLGKEFTRPIIVDHDVQVTVDALKKRRSGDKDAQPDRTQKVNYQKQIFLTQFLDSINVKEFVKTPITLRNSEQAEFLKDAKALMKVSPERRRALLDVIREVLPKVEGLGMKTALGSALESGNAADFITFTDVQDEDDEGGV